MGIYDEMRRDLNELVSLVRQSERYMTSISANPKLASEATHTAELQREHRIAELSARYGITA
ncbi:hypothetical protein QRD43_21240 [Pelomonas sp. APW6]|uniref:Uncharacterized protein n=1 Tax=Roseateles subflavus TaxID=3053353 RepID=A0ABT7LNK6_9BURK|nr:hypothetical protein [Pelomonas sp. APW6]MDL5034442.1 hypothetical protein [Pelomonas sp. APW6]